jgi:O-antigen ligase
MTGSGEATASAMTQWLAVAVFGALPTLGLIAGPSYSSLIFGLAVVQLIHFVLVQRKLPALDRELGLVAAAFAALCWASVMWSIAPARSLSGALQISAIFIGGLVFLSLLPPADAATERLFRILLVATLVGAAVIAVDRLLGYPLEAVVAGRPGRDASIKYNRGIDYLVLLAWPQFAFATWHRRRRHTLLLAVGMIVILAAGLSVTGQMAAFAGLVVMAVAYAAPRVVPPIFAGGTALLAAGVPFALRLLASHRAALVPYVKLSGLQRLEIWDYMTAHVMQRPLLGWGIAAASAVPITKDELSHYVVQHNQGIYPHDQWLELWVETGALGAVIGLVFALLVVRRIQRLGDPIRPFACAAFASAVTISCLNFEVITDSWWAALTACAYLFATIGRCADRR